MFKTKLCIIERIGRLKQEDYISLLGAHNFGVRELAML